MYIDIHNHCLPGVDDGAESLEEALAMVRQYRQENIDEIIVTPHFYHRGRGQCSAKRILEETDRLREALRRQGIEFKLHAGNEIYYSHAVPDLLDQGEALTLAGSRYALIEFSPVERFEAVRDGLYNILQSGHFPVLAHAERLEVLADRVDRLDQLVSMGAYIQMNLGSVKTKADHRRRHFVKKAMESGLVHFLATDAHGSTGRTPEARRDLEHVRRKFGETFLTRMMYDNPKKIIEDQIIL